MIEYKIHIVVDYINISMCQECRVRIIVYLFQYVSEFNNKKETL